MKKFFTLLLSSLFSLSLLAYDGSRLSVTTVGNSSMEFKVEIDGRKIAMQDNSITISNLAEGNHNVRIFREKKRSGNGFGFGRKQEIIYATTVYLRKGFHLDFTVNRFGKVMMDERQITRSDDWYDGEDEDFYDDIDGWNNNATVISTRDFESVKQMISREWLETNRLNSAKVIMDKNYFTTRQVRELMSLFSFESNKLEVAKYAYKKTVDKQNFLQVNDEFSFNSSRDELARFIRQTR